MAMPAEQLRSAPSAWRSRFDPFWRWWTGELAKLLPARFGNLSGVSRAPLVSLEDDAIVVLEARGPMLAEIARAPVATLDPEGRRLALRNLIAGTGATETRVRLTLGRDEALLRRVSLPLATEENLAQVLAFEMDRLSPFRAEDVYFDHRIASRDASAGKVMVDLAVARRELVDARVAALREWGAEVDGVMLADDVARSATPLDLLPETQHEGHEMSRERTIQLGLGALVILLLALALVLPIWQKREAVIALMPVVNKAKMEAEATDALSRELEKQVGDYNFLLSKKHGSHPTLALIEEISRLLPDNTWVQSLDIRPSGKIREVQIAGETPSSSKLIEIFEQATTVRNAAPRGTVTAGSQPRTERFVIAAEVKPRPLPEAQPAASVAAAPTLAPPAAPVPAPVAPAPAPQDAAAQAPATATRAAPPSQPPAKLVPGK